VRSTLRAVPASDSLPLYRHFPFASCQRTSLPKRVLKGKPQRPITPSSTHVRSPHRVNLAPAASGTRNTDGVNERALSLHLASSFGSVPVRRFAAIGMGSSPDPAAEVSKVRGAQARWLSRLASRHGHRQDGVAGVSCFTLRTIAAASSEPYPLIQRPEAAFAWGPLGRSIGAPNRKAGGGCQQDRLRVGVAEGEVDEACSGDLAFPSPAAPRARSG